MQPKMRCFEGKIGPVAAGIPQSFVNQWEGVNRSRQMMRIKVIGGTLGKISLCSCA